jgi:phage terminase small subunit
MSTLPDKPDWGELGPAMRVLTPLQQDFVKHLLTGKPGHGSLTAAARKAGYGKQSTAITLTKHAHDLSRNPRIIAAISVEAKKVIRGVGHAEAVAAVMNGIRDVTHRDHARFVDMILSRADAAVTKQSIDVVHRHIDADQEGLEELRALRKLGTSREKLLELYGGNGLVRLERLEAADIERRADNAKVIDGELIGDGENRQ